MSLLAATISYYVVERPALRLRRGGLRGYRQAATVGQAGMTAKLRTLIIIPALNEEASLPRVLEDLACQLPDFDVLVVDDGSRDATAHVAASCGVAVLSLPFNLGVGGALQTGFRYAVRHDYDRAIQFDADGQHDPTRGVEAAWPASTPAPTS